MRPALVATLLLTATAPLPAQTSAPYTRQLRATVLVSRSGPVTPDAAPVVSRAAQPSHLERNVAGGAAAGAIFAFIITSGMALQTGVSTGEAMGILVPRMLAGAGIGAVFGLLLGALPEPPCGCP